ncbi:hypothetical protein JAAARDRAFT_311867 [Jaapia argillacea MUCL 33604]|uniref:Uncharacterized protein n=1 Tax=Jaapia argillacea MUCL 33604 TaxID=933084 RepID=A0A067PNU9_9AGAM|nr:hypothetical protein JAAARDRAFT_311867 [Jaapia argillacea MUCL 33604]
MASSIPASSAHPTSLTSSSPPKPTSTSLPPSHSSSSSHLASSHSSTIPSSSGVTATSTPSPPPTPSANEGLVAAGVTLGILGFFMIVGIVVFALRLRKKGAKQEDPQNPNWPPRYPRHTMVASQHPANQITPYGSPVAETPRYSHHPGENMRIAQRRPDGGWDFIDPHGPLQIPNTQDHEPLPTPTIRTPLYSNAEASSSNKEVAMSAGQVTSRGVDDLGDGWAPPPAYS